jgi:hypothetical protein
MTEQPSDRLDPELPNPAVPVDPDGDPESVPADPDVEPTAAPGSPQVSGAPDDDPMAVEVTATGPEA